MNYDKNIFEIVKKIKESCEEYLDYVNTYNECAYSDRSIESILDYCNKLAVNYSNNFEDDNIYEYNILNYWNDQDDLYVNYTIENINTKEKANVISYYNTSDLDCNYNTSSDEEINRSLLNLIKQNNGLEFTIPKVSEISPLLTYLYDYVSESESNMCHIDYEDWRDLKENNDFTDEDINLLRKEVEKYNLLDYITIDDGEYQICCYGGLQCAFNDDRQRGSDEHER